MSTRQIEGVAVRLPAQVRYDTNPGDVILTGSPLFVDAGFTAT